MTDFVLTTSAAAYAWRQDKGEFSPLEVVPTALVNTITTNYGVIEGDEVAVRVAVSAEDTADIVPEGELIPMGEPELNEEIIRTVKIGKVMRVSNEQARQENTNRYVGITAQRAIIAAADKVLLDKEAPEEQSNLPLVVGLLHQGIADGGVVSATFDGLIDAIATSQAAGGHPSHFVLAPSTWAALRKFKTATGSALNILGGDAEGSSDTLLGLPVLVNNAVPAKSGLLVDRSDIASAVGPVRVDTTDSAYFAYDSYGIRVTFRFGAKVIHPNRHVKFTVK